MSVEAIELEEMRSAPGTNIGALKNISLIKDVKVRLEVYVGEAEISVGELFDLKVNSVIKLKKEAGAPVDILLDGKVVARGKLSAVGDKFGIRVTQVS